MSFKHPCSPVFHIGDTVYTSYGNGVIRKFRNSDGMYEIDLDYSARLVTMTPSHDKRLKARMEFSAALEVYELKRKIDFELTCSEAGIPPEAIDHTKCTSCTLMVAAKRKVITDVSTSSLIEPLIIKHNQYPLKIRTIQSPFGFMSSPNFFGKQDMNENMNKNDESNEMMKNNDVHDTSRANTDMKPDFLSSFFGNHQESSKTEESKISDTKSGLAASPNNNPSLRIPILGQYLFQEENNKKEEEQEANTKESLSSQFHRNTNWFSTILGKQDSVVDNTTVSSVPHEKCNNNVHMSQHGANTDIPPLFDGSVSPFQVYSEIQNSIDTSDVESPVENKTVVHSTFVSKKPTPENKPKIDHQSPVDIPTELDSFMLELIFGKEKSPEKDNSSIEVNKTKNLEKLCLLCGSPTCSKHCSSDFSKEKLTLCMSCVEFLEFDYDIPFEVIAESNLAAKLNRLVHLYDRALLLLKYYNLEMEDIITHLEESMKQTNKMVVGGSSVGLVSGVLGVAAACTALTPVGPPLLMASLVCGGSAVAVHSGSEALRYFSESHDMADQIIALYGMMLTIGSKVQNMREKTLDPYLDQAIIHLSIVDTGEEKEGSQSNSLKLDSSHHRDFTSTWKSSNHAKRSAVILTARVGTVPTGTASFDRFITKTSQHLSHGVKMMKFAGGALCAVTLVLEANILSHTIDQIQKGSPCDKAELLRKIQDEIDEFLPTVTIDSICQSYWKVRTIPESITPTLKHSSTLQQDDNKEGKNMSMENMSLVDEVISCLETQHQPSGQKSNNDSNKIRNASNLTKSSLLERIRRYKEREMIETEKVGAE
jgi:hypothetical protein